MAPPQAAPAAAADDDSPAPQIRPTPPRIVETVTTDLSYLDRPAPFFTTLPDSDGQQMRSFENYWMGVTVKAAVMVKRLPGGANWEPRMGMLISTELTFRSMDNNEQVLACVKRGEVSSDRGVEVMNATVDPGNYESADAGFKITATNFTGGEDVVFLVKFVSPPAGKQSQEIWLGAFKKNGWEQF